MAGALARVNFFPKHQIGKQWKIKQKFTFKSSVKRVFFILRINYFHELHNETTMHSSRFCHLFDR